MQWRNSGDNMKKQWDIKITEPGDRPYYTVGYYLGSYFKNVRHCNDIKEAEEALTEYIEMEGEEVSKNEKLFLKYMSQMTGIFISVAEDLEGIRKELESLNTFGLRRRKR